MNNVSVSEFLKVLFEWMCVSLVLMQLVSYLSLEERKYWILLNVAIISVHVTQASIVVLKDQNEKRK